jgi:hypothetical protein
VDSGLEVAVKIALCLKKGYFFSLSCVDCDQQVSYHQKLLTTYPGLGEALFDADGASCLPVLYAVALVVRKLRRVLAAVGAKAGGATTSIGLVGVVDGFHAHSRRGGGVQEARGCSGGSSRARTIAELGWAHSDRNVEYK